MQDTWNINALEHNWIKDDGSYAKCPVTVKKKKRIKCGNTSFTHIANINAPDPDGLAQAANFIQGLDSVVMSRMVMMAKDQGYELYGIHDSFWCHPNHMQQTRENYLAILIDLAKKPVMVDWLNSMYKKKRFGSKPQEEIDAFVDLLKTSEYALS